MTTAGSLTRWLVDELNRVKGWGSDGAAPIAIGGQLSTELAALKTDEVDAFIDAPAIGYELETEEGRAACCSRSPTTCMISIPSSSMPPTRW